ncbi:MAG: HlyD family efflux transporter periplasmic adaptor subunit [Phycisphaerae bacterium]
MSAAATQPGAADLASRLRGVHVGMRDDLEVSRHVFRGQPSYVMRDPVTFHSHRLDPADYEIVVRLNPTESLGDTFDKLCAAKLAEREHEAEFYQFVFSLHRLGFLSLPFVDDKLLYKRHKTREAGKRRALWMSLMFLQVPLVNPDAFLNRTMRFADWLFSRGFFAVWLTLTAGATVIGLTRWDDLFQPLDGLLATSNLLIMWATLIVLKLFHELGHAYACKHFGGHVPEMGAYIILATPCAYVDASASWGFSSKRDRIIVCLAGMYVESIFASLATIVWALTEPGLVHATAYNVIFLASITTVLFNINPLMRYDGYYVLSDLVEIPNLKQRATDALNATLKRRILGVRTAMDDTSAGVRIGLIIFGAASAAYRIVVVLGIVTILALKVGPVGLIGGVLYAGGAVVSLLRKLFTYLAADDETAPVRTRAIALGIAAGVIAPLSLLAIPVQATIHAPAVVGAEAERVQFARSDATLRAVERRSGGGVRAGDVLAQLENDELALQTADAETRLEQAQIRAAARATEEVALAQQEQTRVAALEHEVALHRRRQDELTLRAPIDGRLVSAASAREVGRFVRAGEPLATIIDGRTQVRALLTESELVAAGPCVGDRSIFRAAGIAERAIGGVVAQVRPLGNRLVQTPSLTLLGGGDITVDPLSGEAMQPYFEVVVDLSGADVHALRYGMTGRLRLSAEWEPLGLDLYRRFLRLLARTEAS